MTKRSCNICIILGIILTVILELLTLRVMRYNIVLIIISAFLYLVNIIFLEADIYWTFKKNFNKYHSYSILRDIGFLGIQLPIYYLLANFVTMSVCEIIIAMEIVLIFLYGAIWFAKLAQKNSPYVYAG